MVIIFIATIVSWEEKIGQVLFLCGIGLFLCLFLENLEILKGYIGRAHTHQI